MNLLSGITGKSVIFVFLGGVYPIVDNCVCKDFYPADRLIHDITLALMATQPTEGRAGHFPYDSDGSRKRKKPRQRFVDEVWPGVKPG